MTSDIKLFNMDCIEALREMEDNQFDLAIVDPPYGIGESRSHESRNRVASKQYKHKEWDNNTPTPEYFMELNRVSKNMVIFGANHFGYLPGSSCWIVWDKENGACDFADAELAYTTFDSAVRIFKFRWAGMLQGDMKNKEHRIHPTQKPAALYKWLLNNYAKEGDKILDTHLGSGSIAIACHDLKFDLTGYELDIDYFNAATERLKAHQAQGQLF